MVIGVKLWIEGYKEQDWRPHKPPQGKTTAFVTCKNLPGQTVARDCRHNHSQHDIAELDSSVKRNRVRMSKGGGNDVSKNWCSGRVNDRAIVLARGKDRAT